MKITTKGECYTLSPAEDMWDSKHYENVECCPCCWCKVLFVTHNLVLQNIFPHT